MFANCLISEEISSLLALQLQQTQRANLLCAAEVQHALALWYHPFDDLDQVVGDQRWVWGVGQRQREGYFEQGVKEVEQVDTCI